MKWFLLNIIYNILIFFINIYNFNLKLGEVVSGLIWPVAMVQMGTMIDNPWTSGLDK